MRTIWKTPLEVTDEQIVKVPWPAEPLTVQWDLKTGELVAWWMVDTDMPMEPRKIGVYGTGNPCDAPTERHIGTVQMGPLVWHVFDLTRGPS